MTVWSVARPVPPFVGFPRQEYWSGLPFPSLGHLPDPGIEPASPALQANSLPLSPQDLIGTISQGTELAPAGPPLLGLSRRMLQCRWGQGRIENHQGSNLMLCFMCIIFSHHPTLPGSSCSLQHMEQDPCLRQWLVRGNSTGHSGASLL